MTKDKALEELFLSQTPQFDDSAAFMAKLTKRLEAVEYIRQHQESVIRRYKMATVAAFVVGLISGAIMIAFVLSMPADVPLFTFDVDSDILLWLSANYRFITTAVLGLLMSLALTSIIGNVQDIMMMREKQINHIFCN